MKKLTVQKRTLVLTALLLPLLLLFVYVTLRSGPLAPVSVVVTRVERKNISPKLHGMGTVEARHAYKIGPTFVGRLKRLDVEVGEYVKAGQLLGEIDPVDLDERIKAQDAMLKRTKAQLSEAQAHKNYAQTQAIRYKQLLEARSTSEEVVVTKEQQLMVAKAGVAAAEEEISRAFAERKALEAQRDNLRLISPIDGLVVSRNADPGSTIVAGQTVVELIDPKRVWINVRLDQARSRGVTTGLSAQITLPSQEKELLTGHLLRVEPLADAVTEELLAKVVFDQIPDPLPPIGEIAEITMSLPMKHEVLVISNAAIHHKEGKLGVWQVLDNGLHFTQVSLGRSDLDGYIEVREGLKEGDQIVLYSENALHEYSRIKVVDHISGVME